MTRDDNRSAVTGALQKFGRTGGSKDALAISEQADDNQRHFKNDKGAVVHTHRVRVLAYILEVDAELARRMARERRLGAPPRSRCMTIVVETTHSVGKTLAMVDGGGKGSVLVETTVRPNLPRTLVPS